MNYMTGGSRKGYQHEYAGSPVDNRKDESWKINDESRYRAQKEPLVYKPPDVDVCWNVKLVESIVPALHFLIGKGLHFNSRYIDPTDSKQGGDPGTIYAHVCCTLTNDRGTLQIARCTKTRDDG